VLLPAGHLDDGRDGGPLRALQHGDHGRLLGLGSATLGGLLPRRVGLAGAQTPVAVDATAEQPRPALSLPDRPSIAVLPFLSTMRARCGFIRAATIARTTVRLS